MSGAPALHTGTAEPMAKPAGKRTPRERIASVSRLLAKLDEHAAQLAMERARVAAELAKLLAKVNLHPAQEEAGGAELAARRQQQATAAARAKEAARRKDARGKCAAMCIEEIDAVAALWSSAVACVALGKSSVLLLYDDARPKHTRDFDSQCAQLAEELGKRTAAMAPAVYAAVGGDDRFYVRFADGGQQWVASAQCAADIRAKPVAQVSFGASYEAYAVLYLDGSARWHGVPPKFAAKLAALTPRSPSIAHLCLGPDHEWFVSFLDGTWEMGGCSDALADKVSEVLNSGNAIKLITFGGNDSWLIRYNKPARANTSRAK